MYTQPHFSKKRCQIQRMQDPVGRRGSLVSPEDGAPAWVSPTLIFLDLLFHLDISPNFSPWDGSIPPAAVIGSVTGTISHKVCPSLLLAWKTWWVDFQKKSTFSGCFPGRFQEGLPGPAPDSCGALQRTLDKCSLCWLSGLWLQKQLSYCKLCTQQTSPAGHLKSLSSGQDRY